jgi:hypothetical protein
MRRARFDSAPDAGLATSHSARAHKIAIFQSITEALLLQDPLMFTPSGGHTIFAAGGDSASASGHQNQVPEHGALQGAAHGTSKAVMLFKSEGEVAGRVHLKIHRVVLRWVRTVEQANAGARHRRSLSHFKRPRRHNKAVH